MRRHYVDHPAKQKIAKLGFRMPHQRYELWLLTHPRGGMNRRISREDRQNCDAQTPFQHAIGIRYKREGQFLYPQTRIHFLTFGRCGPPRTMSELFVDIFSGGRHPRKLTKYRTGSNQQLQRATGYATFSSSKLKRRSVKKCGAVYSGSIWVHEKYQY